MLLHVLRYATSEFSTLGAFYIDGFFSCHTLEDPYKMHKVPSLTRIPEGIYTVSLRTTGGWHKREQARYGIWHRGMLHIDDVPNYKYILIHPGNTPDDTEGCLLVGDNVTRQINGTHIVPHSRTAYERFYPRVADALLGGETVKIRFSSYA